MWPPPARPPVPSDRARMYDGLIAEHARRNDIRPDLVRAVVQVESACDPNARSPKGAQGLMQLMPATAQQFGVKNAYNPDENVRTSTPKRVVTRICCESVSPM